MVLLDLLGRRWALGILWQLQEGACTFRDLQDRCESISPSVLNTRLKDLRAAHLVERTPEGYALTLEGRALFDLIEPLGAWAKDWVGTL
jgi:DNA-binding HxlR family transcriptional regulator